jgi:hypothetical protein
MLLVSNVSKWRESVLGFMMLMAVGGSTLFGGWAHHIVSRAQSNSAFYYEAAPILNEVPADSFSIYVERWKEQHDSQRLLWVYRLFFDQRVSDRDSFDSLAKNENEIAQIISFLRREDQIPFAQGTHILTDRPTLIVKFYPQAEVVGQTVWRSVDLYFVDISNMDE